MRNCAEFSCGEFFWRSGAQLCTAQQLNSKSGLCVRPAFLGAVGGVEVEEGLESVVVGADVFRRQRTEVHPVVDYPQSKNQLIYCTPYDTTMLHRRDH